VAHFFARPPNCGRRTQGKANWKIAKSAAILKLPGSHIIYFCMHLLVYSAPWCGDCREAKRFLDKHNIPYQEVNIETTPGAADEVIRNSGKRAIPQFVINGKWVQPYRPGEGFLYAEMSELLGIPKS
jgi:glutaredoxin